MQLEEIDLTALDDSELRQLGMYRDWLLDIPEGHPEYATAKRRADAVRAEAERRKQAPA